MSEKNFETLVVGAIYRTRSGAKVVITNDDCTCDGDLYPFGDIDGDTWTPEGRRYSTRESGDDLVFRICAPLEATHVLPTVTIRVPFGTNVEVIYA